MAEVTMATAIQCVREVLDHKHADAASIAVDDQSSLESLHFDSLDIAMLFTALEDRVGTELDPDSVPELATIEDLTFLRPTRSAPSALSELRPRVQAASTNEEN